MSARGELAKSGPREGWPCLMLLGLAIPSLIRGIDRIGDGHPLSGWLAAASGALMVSSAVGMWMRSRG